MMASFRGPRKLPGFGGNFERGDHLSLLFDAKGEHRVRPRYRGDHRGAALGRRALRDRSRNLGNVAPTNEKKLHKLAGGGCSMTWDTGCAPRRASCREVRHGSGDPVRSQALPVADALL